MTTIHVHAFPLAPCRPLLDEAAACLPADELERGARFRVDHARDEFLLSRLLLRRTLAAYLDRPAGGIVLVRNPHGKPSLSPAGKAGLEFNLSHSHGQLLIALCRDYPVGVDIERIDPAIDPLPLARHGLPAEDLRRLGEADPDDRIDLFFTLWSRREAYLKALGRGFARVGAEPGRVHGAGNVHPAGTPEADGWVVVRDLAVPAGFRAAVALAGSGPPPVPRIVRHGADTAPQGLPGG